MTNVNFFERSEIESLIESIHRKIGKNAEVLQSEVFASCTKAKTIKFEEGQIKIAQEKKSEGIGIRLIGKEGREGMTFTANFTETALDNIILSGIKMMKASTPNPDFKNLALPSNSYTPVKNIYDSEIENLSLEEISDYLFPIFRLEQKPLSPVALSGGFNTSVGMIFVSNSNGINQWEKSSTAGVSAEINLTKDGVISNGFDWQGICQLKELDVEKVANRSYNMAYRSLKKKSIKTGEYSLILSPLAVASFLVEPFLSAINAESIQNNMSFLANQLNMPIGSEFFTLKDDPHIDGKLGTESFDAEGVATQQLTLVENGILNNHYHNSFTANKEGLESNGHAARSGYTGRVSISGNNVIMPPGTKSKDELISEIKNGIYFEYTGDHPNNITGDFSGLIMLGNIIEEGQLGPALLETLLGINLLDAYQRIEAVSKEREWVDEYYLPWVKISKAMLSGRE